MKNLSYHTIVSKNIALVPALQLGTPDHCILHDKMNSFSAEKEIILSSNICFFQNSQQKNGSYTIYHNNIPMSTA